MDKIAGVEVVAVTVDTFGVDGAPFDAGGNMLYPVISWQCKRTARVMKNIGQYISPEKLCQITGLQPFPFNTITKLIWLKENEPQVIEKLHSFLFIPSIFLYRLSGEMVTDTSMAGTSMLTDLKKRDFSDEVLSAAGLDRSVFPRLVEPGEVAGQVTAKASGELGIPAGIPVVATGHDTQFAIFGSGAGEHTPVLSSGTWEILMVRTHEARIDRDMLTAGVTTELDSMPGLYNPGVQWIASGTLEWIKRMFYAEEAGKKDVYHTMTGEAGKISPGSGGIRINPSFFPGSEGQGNGMISGLTMETTRGEVYRAALEALACRTGYGLSLLQQAGNFKATHLLCVGGGSKNRLWNQIRADILDIPVRVVKQSETTVLGAAMFAFAGAGIYSGPAEAQHHFTSESEEFLPRKHKIYKPVIEEYRQVFKNRQTIDKT
ncbi:MAG: L-fuculokinase [Chlorobi bacterium]|nr:L-fuculokinase [Chlorobiota bacterium]